MIVVTAMPVANAKARTIITKIVFMTLILGTSQAVSLSMTEPVRRSVTGITNDRFHGNSGSRVRAGRLITFCIHCRFGFVVLGAGALERGQISTLASTLSPPPLGLLFVLVRDQSRCLVTFARIWTFATMPAELAAARSKSARAAHCRNA